MPGAGWPCRSPAHGSRFPTALGKLSREPLPARPPPHTREGTGQGAFAPLGHLSFAQGPLSFEFLRTALDPRAPKPPLVSCSLRTPWFPPSLVFPSSCSPSSKPLFNAPCSPRAQLTQEQGRGCVCLASRSPAFFFLPVLGQILRELSHRWLSTALETPGA